jgi:hypothetical protein
MKRFIYLILLTLFSSCGGAPRNDQSVSESSETSDPSGPTSPDYNVGTASKLAITSDDLFISKSKCSQANLSSGFSIATGASEATLYISHDTEEAIALTMSTTAVSGVASATVATTINGQTKLLIADSELGILQTDLEESTFEIIHHEIDNVRKQHPSMIE